MSNDMTERVWTESDSDSDLWTESGYDEDDDEEQGWTASDVAPDSDGDLNLIDTRSQGSDESLSALIEEIYPIDGINAFESSGRSPIPWVNDRRDEEEGNFDVVLYNRDDRVRATECTEEEFRQIALTTVMDEVNTAIQSRLTLIPNGLDVYQIRLQSFLAFWRHQDNVRERLNELPGETTGVSTAGENIFLDRLQVLGVQYTFNRADRVGETEIHGSEISVWTTLQLRNGAWEPFLHSDGQECTCDHYSPNSCLAAEIAAQNQRDANREENRTVSTGLSTA
ncbi:hypothetical protein BCR39DRAFT_576619 [Naematelia encephala]|uniref:Uncharacterized protein n=1 Tax=Naematelia encephala TaxID=71784 RepID=A0A1Y2B0H4_9TREE|nr:hypothetical protein BCR39DRAFT_576619 [Naematelia encephala]